jgi:hypothetical protein
MKSVTRRHLLCWGLLLVGVSVAPVAQEAGPKANAKQQALAEARYKAAIKQFDLIWEYYAQNRVGSIEVYIWSRLALDAKKELSDKPAHRIEAIEDHLKRMKALQELVTKIRQIGFGRSSDVGASEYYRLEAEYWLAQAKS